MGKAKRTQEELRRGETMCEESKRVEKRYNRRGRGEMSGAKKS